MSRKNRDTLQLPALLPVTVAAPVEFHYSRPAILNRMRRRWRLTRFIRKSIREAGLDEFSTSAFDRLWDSVRMTALAQLESRKSVYDREIEEALLQCELESGLLESYDAEIQEELTRCQEELAVLEQHTYKWQFETGKEGE